MSRQILIAGGGVAGLEAALALRALAPEPRTVDLLGPEPDFWYRPLAVAEPFDVGEAKHYDLGELAAIAGAAFTLGSLQGVDADAHVAKTTAGDIPYDALLIAVGAVPVAAVDGALTFRGPGDTEKVRRLLDEIVAGDVHRVAFVVPPGFVWSLPIYELALMTSAHLARLGVRGVELVLVTLEHEPLSIFGSTGSAAVRELLEAHGVEIHTDAYAAALADRELLLLPEGHIMVDRAVALPRLRGSWLDGVPQTLDGFIPVDSFGRVRGLDDVYAAGDVTAFSVKQGGIATQQAEAAATTIASELGGDLPPEPFRPVLRGLLLTGGAPQYLRRELDVSEHDDVAAMTPLWWPPAKIVGRRLGPFLAEFAGIEHPQEPPAAPSAIRVDVELPVDEPSLPLRLPPDALDDGDATAGETMAADPLVVAPEDTLAEIAEKMRAADVGSALVADYGRLIGILTSRDFLRAFAARMHPSDARAREWMTADPVVVPASAAVELAVRLMAEYEIHHLPVVDGRHPIGMLGYEQARRAIRARGIGLGL
jgi:sulfide:quinone oxidoreductase